MTDDITRFRTAFPEWDDLPDHLVETSLAFAWWRNGQAWAALGETLYASMPGWFKRLTRG